MSQPATTPEPTMPQSVVRVAALHKRFAKGPHALRGIDLHVRPGERTVLLGHNGSGKSTLLRCLVGLEPPTSGQIHLHGVELTHARGANRRAIRRHTGVVFQQFNLVETLSVFQNVMLGALGRARLWRLLPMTASSALRAQAMQCLDRVGLADIARQRADRLSGGQRQRVAIARMLMQRPTLILADEPVASLDPSAGQRIMELLWNVAHEQRMTVICTLHDVDMALDYGHRIIGLRHGRIVLDRPRPLTHRDELMTLYQNASRDAAAPVEPTDATEDASPLDAAAARTLV